jgi:uncharacterized protein involved in type VI secretion and phage assembly
MPDIDLMGLLRGDVGMLRSELEQTANPVFGVTLGEVTDVDDPEHLGRIKVRLPWLSSQVESAWARIALPWAGNQRGTYFIPEVGDEVLVAFRHGDIRFPYVLGFLWSAQAMPPEADPRLNRRGFRSKSGHQLTFDDTDVAQKVTIQTSGGHKVVLDDTNGALAVTITDSTGSLSIQLDGTGLAISLTAQTGDIQLNAQAGQVSVNAESIDLTASGTLSIQAGGTVTVQGSMVNIN